MSKVTGRVEKLASFLYQHGDNLQRTRALLRHVYHLALHHRFTEATDLVLVSHVIDTINDSDVETKILFNRMMAQLGLCAFKVGKYQNALEILAEFYPSIKLKDVHPNSKIKELLAQGVHRNRSDDRNYDKENLERRRQYPYHMHINSDLIESFHLMSGMFKEIPLMARVGVSRKRPASRTFRNKFLSYGKQAYQGPPEKNSDAILAAGIALQKGDWTVAWKHLDSLPVWLVIPNRTVVKEKLQIMLKEVALETFLISFGPQLSSISFNRLLEFGLPRKTTYRVASKLIFDDHLQEKPSVF